MIRFIKLTFIFSLIMLNITPAQKQKLDFFYAVKGDSVFIYLNQTPSFGTGLIVERRSQGETEFRQLNEAPLKGLTDGNRIPVMLGDYYDVLLKALRMDSPSGLLIKLRTDPYYGQIGMLLDRRIAQILGRYFSTGNNTTNTTYTYRVKLVNRKGEVTQKAEREIFIRDNVIKPVDKITCRQEKMKAVIEWEYPAWSGDMNDIAFQFMLFRKEGKGAYQTIHDYPLLRLEGFPLLFEDKDILPGKSYTYRIVAMDALKRLSDGLEVQLSVRDIIPPERPKGLTSDVSSNQVKLSWQGNSDADLAGYHIYRWNAGEKDSIRVTKNILPVEQNEYTDLTAQLGTSYFYAVTALDKSGNESKHSNRMNALITDKTPPEPVRNFNVELIKEGVLINWDKSTSKDASGYIVRRGYNDENAFKLQEELVTDTLFIDDGTKGSKWSPGGRYFYSVVTVDTMSYQSVPVGAWIVIPDDEPPLPPGRVLAENYLGREVRVSWNPSISADADAYIICRISNDVETLLDTTAIDKRNFADDQITKGSSFIYGVAAVDTAGNISGYSKSALVTLRDYDPPTAPAFVTAVKTEQGIKINWEPVGDFDLAGYNIYKSNLPTGTGEKLNASPITETKWLDTSAETGMWYWIKGVDTSGNESKKSKPAQLK